MKRKIIQIATMAEGDTASSSVFALCDDGSLHVMTLGGREWAEMPGIPEKVIERNFIGSVRTCDEPEYQIGFTDGKDGLPYNNRYSDAARYTDRQFQLYREGWEAGSNIKLL